MLYASGRPSTNTLKSGLVPLEVGSLRDPLVLTGYNFHIRKLPMSKLLNIGPWILFSLTKFKAESAPTGITRPNLFGLPAQRWKPLLTALLIRSNSAKIKTDSR